VQVEIGEESNKNKSEAVTESSARPQKLCGKCQEANTQINKNVFSKLGVFWAGE